MSAQLELFTPAIDLDQVQDALVGAMGKLDLLTVLRRAAAGDELTGTEKAFLGILAGDLETGRSEIISQLGFHAAPF